MTTSHSESLTNPKCKPRELQCDNPTHSLILMVSDNTQQKCPICNNPMITLIKSVVKIVKNELAE